MFSKMTYIKFAALFFCCFSNVALADCIRNCSAELFVKLSFQPEGATNTIRKTDALRTLISESRDGRSGRKCVPHNILKAKKQACEEAVKALGRRYSSQQRQMEAVCGAVQSDLMSFERARLGFPAADWYSIDEIYAYGERDIVKRKANIRPQRARFSCNDGMPVVFNPSGARPAPPPHTTSDRAAPPPPPTLITDEPANDEPAPLQREADNKQALCEQWCNEHAECVRCDTKAGCGRGYTRLNSWRGPGRNWYACGEKRASTSGAAQPGSSGTSGDQASDLYISEFALTPDTPEKGQPVSVRVGVYNKGTQRAGAFIVEWWPGEKYKEPACSWNIEGMNARGGRILTCTYDGFPSWYGQIVTLVVADPRNEVMESDERNNNFRKTISVSR